MLYCFLWLVNKPTPSNQKKKPEIDHEMVTPPFEAFSCLYFGFWLVIFGCCSLFRLAHVISLVLDFKIFSEPRTLLKDIMTKQLSEKTFTWISSTQVFTFWKERKYSASFVSQELKSTANEHLQVPLLSGFYDKDTCLDFYLLP